MRAISFRNPGKYIHFLSENLIHKTFSLFTPSIPIFKGISEYPKYKSKNFNKESEISYHLNTLDIFFEKFYINDERNLQILKEHLFNLFLAINKKEVTQNEKFREKLKDYFSKIDEKTIKPCLQNFTIFYQKFEREIIDILKHVYIYREKFPENPSIYANFNKLCDMCIDYSLKKYQLSKISMHRVILLINIILNRMIILNDPQTEISFTRLHSLLKENMSLSPPEAVIMLNITMKESGFDKYIIEIPTELIEKMLQNQNFEKLSLIVLRLNRSKINENLRNLIKNKLMEQKYFKCLDLKSISFLVSTHYNHNSIFSKTEIDKMYELLKTISKKQLSFLEISMIMTAFHKGKALDLEKCYFFATELETILFTMGKLNNENINKLNYHSCINILNVLAINISVNNIKLSLLNDLNFILTFHRLKGIRKVEIYSIVQSNGTLLKKIRKNTNLPKNQKDACIYNIRKLLFKIKKMVQADEFKNESFDYLVTFFLTFLQSGDEANLDLIDKINNLLIKDIKYPSKIPNKIIQTFYSNLLELLNFSENLQNQTNLEAKYLAPLIMHIENSIIQSMNEIFKNYLDASHFLQIISLKKELIKNKLFYNEIETKYLESIKNFTFLQNSELTFPLSKFALFSKDEMKCLENYFLEQIKDLKNQKNLEVIIFNFLNSFTHENQFSVEFFIEIENFIIERILQGDLQEIISLSSKSKYFSILGQYDIKTSNFLEIYENFFIENIKKMNLLEILNTLNVLMINEWKNLDLIRNLLILIEEKIVSINSNDLAFAKYLTLIKVVYWNLEYDFPILNMQDFPNILAFYKEKNVQSTIKILNKSYFQTTIKGVLVELGFDFEEEKSIGPFIIDFFIKPNICFEINGKSHYVNENKLNLSTQRKYRLLEKMGYKLKTISPSEWNKIETSWNKIGLIKEKILEI